jgi:Holliday junction resolvase
MASKHQLSGMRGVFLVAAELSERGFVVSPTSRSARGVDLLATNADGTRTFAVEVKSASKTTFWIVGKEAGMHKSRNNIWVFVKFGRLGERARFFVVPSMRLRRYFNKGKTVPFVKRNAISKYEDRWQAFGPSL